VQPGQQSAGLLQLATVLAPETTIDKLQRAQNNAACVVPTPSGSFANMLPLAQDDLLRLLLLLFFFFRYFLLLLLLLLLL